MMIEIAIDPVPKPRMTRADKWKRRPSVLRYRGFADQVRRQLGNIDINGHAITFGLRMPKSWSKKKKAQMDGQAHTQTPDLDNLLKALGDSLYQDDSGVHTLTGLKKVWAPTGFIQLKKGNVSHGTRNH